MPLPGGLRLDVRAARAALRTVAGPFRSLRAAAEGVVAVANAEMVRAIGVVSVEQGHDPRELELVAFGGAGPLHACEVADSLGMRAVVVPAAGGVLSALGIAAGRAPPGRPCAASCAPLAEFVAEPARAPPRAPRGGSVEIECELRYRGQAHELTVPLRPPSTLARRFHARHRERYGFDDPSAEIEVVSVRTSVIVPGPRLRARPGRGASRPCAGRRRSRSTAPRCGLRPAGRPGGARRLVEGRAVTDPAGLQVLAAALRGVAEEMGAALVRSAHSANIKERRDCSTAVFDRDGRMIAQAEHMPVHLGAMPDAVAAVRELRPRPGAVYVLNDPYTGGTHLPDITLVSVVGRPRARRARARITPTSAGCSRPACRRARPS